MQRRTNLYNDEIDAAITAYYMDHKAAEVATMINKELGANLTQNHIWDRAKFLGINKREKLENFHNQPRPRWDYHPEDFVGPCPHRVAGYLIIAYLGMGRYERNNKAKHDYAVRCLVCGEIMTVAQSGLLRAVARGSIGCKKCAQKKLNEDRRRKRAENNEKAQQMFKEWVRLLRLWPVTPLELVPVKRRFDSQRHVK